MQNNSQEALKTSVLLSAIVVVAVSCPLPTEAQSRDCENEARESTDSEREELLDIDERLREHGFERSDTYNDDLDDLDEEEREYVINRCPAGCAETRSEYGHLPASEQREYDRIVAAERAEAAARTASDEREATRVRRAEHAEWLRQRAGGILIEWQGIARSCYYRWPATTRTPLSGVR